MGIQSFNFPTNPILHNLEAPTILIANKDKRIIGAIGIYEDLKITFNLNAFQTASFKIYREINKKVQPYFDTCEEGMLILIMGVGWFEIHVETNFESDITKTISATSLECKLCDKKLVNFQVNSDDFEDDEYVVTTFYNPTEPKKSLLHRILNVSANWTVGHVDDSLANKQRTFDVDDVDVYSFLTGDVSEAFNCLFIFDTFNETVNAYDLDSYGNDTNIFVNTRNLAENITETIDQRSIITCYRVRGGDGVYINEVNPNGTDKIYNFEYYLPYMPEVLQQKIMAYNETYQELKPEYETIVASMQEYLETIQELYTRTPELLTSTDWTQYGLEWLQSKEKSYKTQDEVYCAQGMNSPQSLSYNLYLSNLELLNGVQAEIAVRKAEINSAESECSAVYEALTAIQDVFNMDHWFTEEEWKALDSYVIEETYTNDNFSIADNTSDSELFSLEKELYEAAWKDLEKKCRPQYQYSTTLANLLQIPEFKCFKEKFELGNFMRMGTDYNTVIKLRIISFTVDYSNQENIEVVFSDAVRVKGIYEDASNIQSQANSAAMSFKFNKDQYDSSVKQGNFVAQMRKYGLDVATTQIHNATDQSQTWDETGMTFRKWNDERQDYDPEQIKIINNMMVFSDDGFDSTKMAIGKIALGNGEYAYGINAQVLLSKLIMSENLYIENDSGTYKFTDDGFNASNGTNEIKIQPNKSDELFSIYKGNDKKFYIDADGNVWLIGNITGSTITGGSINGTNISGTTISGGTVSGTNITGSTIDGNTIVGGTITGSTINGGTVNGATIISAGTNGTTTIIGGTVESVGSTYDASLFKLSFGNRNMYLQPQGIVINDVSSSGINQTTISDSIISLSYTRFSDGKKYEVSATPVDLTIPAGYVNECNGGDTAIPNVKWVKDNRTTLNTSADYVASIGGYGGGGQLIKFRNAESGYLTGATAQYVQNYVQNYVDAKSSAFYNQGYSAGYSVGYSAGYSAGAASAAASSGSGSKS